MRQPAWFGAAGIRSRMVLGSTSCDPVSRYRAMRTHSSRHRQSHITRLHWTATKNLAVVTLLAQTPRAMGVMETSTSGKRRRRTIPAIPAKPRPVIRAGQAPRDRRLHGHEPAAKQQLQCADARDAGRGAPAAAGPPPTPVRRRRRAPTRPTTCCCSSTPPTDGCVARSPGAARATTRRALWRSTATRSGWRAGASAARAATPSWPS